MNTATTSTGSPAFSTKSLYKLSIKAMFWGHLPHYLIGAAFVFLLYINIDFKVDGTDSSHFFNLWFLGIIYSAFGVALVYADLLNKPLLFGMALQLQVLRRIVFAFGFVVNLLLFALAVLPKSSHWAPPSAVGHALLIPAGLTLFFLVALITPGRGRVASYSLAGIALVSAGVSRYFFQGFGSEINRPPLWVYALFAAGCPVLLFYVWRVLGKRAWRRRLLTGESNFVAKAKQDRSLEGFNLYVKSNGKQRIPSHSKLGMGLLKALKKSKLGSFWRLLLDGQYRMLSAYHLDRVIVVWFLFLIFATNLAFQLFSQFEPHVFLAALTCLVLFQTPTMFPRITPPLLPLSRVGYFYRCLLACLFRYVLLVVLLVASSALLLYLQNHWPHRFEPDGYMKLSPASCLIYLFLAPLLGFFFNLVRKPLWFLVALLVSWLVIYSAPSLSHSFSQIHGIGKGLALLFAWVPFLSLSYWRSFKSDLA